MCYAAGKGAPGVAEIPVPEDGTETAMSATLLGMMIRQQRQHHGWSQDELAKKIVGTVDQAVVSRLENGLIADPGSKLVFHLAKALGVTTDDLLALLCQGDAESDAAVAPTESTDGEIADVRRQFFQLSARLKVLEEKEKVTSGRSR